MEQEILNWNELIKDYYKSSLSKSKWCEEHNISPELLSQKLKESIDSKDNAKLNVSEDEASIVIKDKWATIEYTKNDNDEKLDELNSNYSAYSLGSGIKVIKEKITFEIPSGISKSDLMEFLEVITDAK